MMQELPGMKSGNLTVSTYETWPETWSVTVLSIRKMADSALGIFSATILSKDGLRRATVPGGGIFRSPPLTPLISTIALFYAGQPLADDTLPWQMPV